MPDNLLINADFSGGTTHKTHDGTVAGEIDVPEGWVAWWDPRRARPEMHVIRLEDPYVGPPRRIPYDVTSGYKAFKPFAKWAGGLYQRVGGLRPGARYRCGFQAHAWANHDGLPWDGRADCSVVGCGPIARPEESLPPLSGDPISDGWYAGLFQVGYQDLDGSESVDPFYRVVWSPAWAIYNSFSYLELEFTAGEEEGAVLLRCDFRWRYRNNDGYLGAAYLYETGQEGRDPWVRTYYLLPPDVTEEEAAGVMRERFTARTTVGYSADDVAVAWADPNVKEIRAIVLRPQAWQGGKAGLLEFWGRHYREPDVITWVGDDDPTEPPEDTSHYAMAQTDPAWAAVGLGGDDCSETIGSAGCYVTCLAMAQKRMAIKTDATPATVVEDLGPSGFVVCHVNRAATEGALRLSVTVATDEAAAEAIAHGSGALAEVAGREHWVYVVAQAGARFYMVDPLTGSSGWLDDTYAGVEEWRALWYKSPTPPPPPPPPPPGEGLTSLHLQRPELVDALGYVRATDARSVKYLAGYDNIVALARLGKRGVYRQWVPNQGVYLDNPDKAAAARAFLDVSRDSLESACEIIARECPGLAEPWFYFESLNEVYACGDPRNYLDSFPVDIALGLELRGYPVSPVGFCAAVGNIHLPDEVPDPDADPAWRAFLELAEVYSRPDVLGALGYHSYWYANDHESGLVPHWRYLAGRFTVFDSFLASRGYRLPWALGEAGVVRGRYVSDTDYRLAAMAEPPAATLRASPVNVGSSDYKPRRAYVGGNSGYVLEPHSGYKLACGWDRYLADVVTFERMLLDSVPGREGRILAANLFTTNGEDSEWRTFEHGRREVELLAQALSR